MGQWEARVALIGIFFLAVLGIFGAAISRQLTDEFKAWAPRLIKRLIQRAVRQLPESQRKRFTEEWQSHVNEIPGEVGKLIVAFGYLKASWKMSRGLAEDTPYAVVKRAIDISVSALFLIINWPIFLFSSLFIKLDSDGPIFYVARRQGHKRNTIRLLKFRTTMIPRNGLPITNGRHGDFHVTVIGKLLRRLGIDELPLLLNVFSGDLSLVGPRPLSSSELDIIDKELSSFSRRKNVKPGLLSWAMVNGLRGEWTTLEE